MSEVFFFNKSQRQCAQFMYKRFSIISILFKIWNSKFQAVERFNALQLELHFRSSKLYLESPDSFCKSSLSSGLIGSNKSSSLEVSNPSQYSKPAATHNTLDTKSIQFTVGLKATLLVSIIKVILPQDD